MKPKDWLWLIVLGIIAGACGIILGMLIDPAFHP